MAGSNIFTNRSPIKQHLLNGGGVAGEVQDLRSDVAKTLSPLAAITVEEWINPAAPAATAIKTSVASSTSVATYTGAALNGAIGAGAISPPRNITATTGGGVNAGDVPATAVITGTDIDGNVLTETLTLGQTDAAVATGVKCFASVTSIALPAGQGTSGTLTFGIGGAIGLSVAPKTRGGGTVPIREVVAGTLVTNGTLASAATSAPHGSYTPNSAPDASRDYAIYYEYDVSTVP